MNQPPAHFQLWFDGQVRHDSAGAVLAGACRTQGPDGSTEGAAYRFRGLPIAQVAELQALIAGLKLLALDLARCPVSQPRVTVHCHDPIIVNRVFNGGSADMLGLAELRDLARMGQALVHDLRARGVRVEAAHLNRRDAQCARLTFSTFDDAFAAV